VERILHNIDKKIGGHDRSWRSRRKLKNRSTKRTRAKDSISTSGGGKGQNQSGEVHKGRPGVHEKSHGLSYRTEIFKNQGHDWKGQLRQELGRGNMLGWGWWKGE